jgi:hypothetical protein
MTYFHPSLQLDSTGAFSEKDAEESMKKFYPTEELSTKMMTAGKECVKNNGIQKVQTTHIILKLRICMNEQTWTILIIGVSYPFGVIGPLPLSMDNNCEAYKGLFKCITEQHMKVRAER